MLGMAANNSIKVLTTLLRRGGASSTRNRAMTILMGTASTMAMRVDTTVP